MSASTAIHNVADPTIGERQKHRLQAQRQRRRSCECCAALRARDADANGIFSSSSAISAMSAVSSAASVPAAPIAMPTSAAASAGASFTPSPTIATVPYFAAKRLNGRHFVVRAAAPRALRRCRAPARARRLSPGCRRSASRRAPRPGGAASRPRRGRLHACRSASAMIPSGRPARATSTAVRPDAASVVQPRMNLCVAEAALLDQAMVADQRGLAADDRLGAAAGQSTGTPNDSARPPRIRPRLGKNRAANRMLRSRLEAGGDVQNLARCRAVQRNDFDDVRRAFRERSRLVERHAADRSRSARDARRP